ncbi:hypothetical protein C5167_020710, partial [Papaver somniferum]
KLKNITTATRNSGEGLRQYYIQHLHDLQLQVRPKSHYLNRLEAQHIYLNLELRQRHSEDAQRIITVPSGAWILCQRRGENYGEIKGVKVS